MCADGFVQPGETCDGGKNAMGDAVDCRADCTYCGDLLQNGPEGEEAEDCDEGVNNKDSGSCTAFCKTAKCGDGLLQVGVEECDGNPNPMAKKTPCSDKCTKTGLLVFVSSSVTSGAISFPADPNPLEGIPAADAICAKLGESGSLKGTGFSTDGTRWPFKAWLSGGALSSSPSISFPSLADDQHAGLAYIRPDGELVAGGSMDLLDDTLGVPISVTEAAEGVEGDALVWTGTKADGMFNGAKPCAGWKSEDSSAVAGSTGKSGSQWTNLEITDCKMALHLYCFEQPPK